MNSSPLRVAITGLGGFAASHHRALLALENAGVCQVVGACDPFPNSFLKEQKEWRFKERGVRVFGDWQAMLDMLADEVDVLTVPAPLPLHAPIHKVAVERGIACYLEKPPTLFWRELDEMLEVEKTARFATNVGFNFIIETARQNLKQRILSGEFGKLLRVSFLGHWPRPKSYFTRSPWAGKISLDGRLVLDSCIGNAMAHYIHNLLFWAGTRELFDWANVAGIEAALYRAHAIENYDTVFTRGVFENGVQFLIAATHASKPPQYHREKVICEKAAITYVAGSEWKIEWRDGRDERIEKGEADRSDLLARNFTAYFDYLCGAASRPPTTLQESKPFVHLTNLVYVAADEIETVDEEFTVREDEWIAIGGVEKMMEEFVSRPFGYKNTLKPAKAADVVKLEDILKSIGSS
jgi:predicted dehydrogenase